MALRTLQMWPFRGYVCLKEGLKGYVYKYILLGGFIFFNFHPYLGKIPILTHIFQMG